MVFSWSVIGWVYFLWKVNLENYSSSFVTWMFCVTREEAELLTDIRDFTTLLYVILRHKSSKWLESSMQWLRYVICNTWPFAVLLSWNTVSSVRTGYFEYRVSYSHIFVIRENETFISVIRDLLYFLFVNHARDSPLYDPLITWLLSTLWKLKTTLISNWNKRGFCCRN